jgi:hypothetical protein
MEWFMNWWWATIFGPIVLAAVIAYALLTRRKLPLPEKRAQDQAVNALYDDPDGRSSPQGKARQRPTAD